MDKGFANILLLGLAFMVLFTAFQATSMISQSVLEGVKNESIHGNTFHGSGYASSAILYACFAFTNIFAPAIVSIFGPSLSMFLGGITYFLYVLSFIYPMTWSYYIVSILVGIGAAVLWTAQGVFLTANSNESTASRNAGIFWALFQVSLLAGNIYVYVALKTELIGRAKRIPLFTVFSVVSTAGLVIFLFIIWRSYVEKRREPLISNEEVERSALGDVINTLKIAVKLLKTRNMLFILLAFAYTGISQTFFQGVYGTCIGHYVKYGDNRKRLIGLHGLLVGCGEILGGGLFGFITKPKTPSHKALMVVIGFLLQIVYYYSVFVNFPSNASYQETSDKSYFDFSEKTSQIIAFSSSFIVGLGDSSFNTQLLSVLALRYKHTSASAFALTKLVQSLMAAVAFFYAGTLEIQWQLLIAIIGLFLATLVILSVLFDETTDEPVATAVAVTVQDNDDDDNYPNYSTSMAS